MFKDWRKARIQAKARKQHLNAIRRAAIQDEEKAIKVVSASTFIVWEAASLLLFLKWFEPVEWFEIVLGCTGALVVGSVLYLGVLAFLPLFAWNGLEVLFVLPVKVLARFFKWYRR